jgi:apolipoprotein D and lipocalin family protein
MVTVKIMKRLLVLLFLLSGCTGIPDSVQPIDDFNLQRYLGTWHEIARLDHSFERGLEQVTAHYSMREDGGVAVVNRGFSAAKQEWQDAEGKAYLVDKANVGHIKVSFFGPFYGSYIIVELDPDRYSLVSGPNYDYLWILGREPTLDPQTLQRLVEKARSLGFDTRKLIYPAPYLE